MADFEEFRVDINSTRAGSPLQHAFGALSSSATNPKVILGLATLAFILLLTRLTSAKPARQNGAVHSVPGVPYWMPLAGHIPNMAFDADGFLKSLRSSYSQGIFALNFGGTRHNIIYTPSLATALLNQKHSNADSDQVGRGMLQNVFGFPKAELPKYDASFKDLMACYKHILSEPGLGIMVNQTANKIKHTIADLVTFNGSPVDQTPWERTSNVSITKNKSHQPVVEASLLSLVRDYAAQTANPSIMGSDFLANFPDFLTDIWRFDRGFLLLATGLPRWLPLPALTRAHIARRRLLDSTTRFHAALEDEANGADPGPKWHGLDDVGALVKARVAVYRQYGYSVGARAAVETSLMWAANANSDMLVFWLLNRIYADRALLEMVREEIAPYARAVEPAPQAGFRVAERPRLDAFDVEGLCERCPLLKSCYVECLRLDTASWSLKVVQRDFVLQGREKDAVGWQLRKGDYAHAAHDLHNTDPKYFKDPLVFRADRHIREEGDGDQTKRTADLGSIRPYGALRPAKIQNVNSRLNADYYS